MYQSRVDAFDDLSPDTPLHPAVLRVLHEILALGRRTGTPVTVRRPVRGLRFRSAGSASPSDSRVWMRE